jgi:hypothetical protein
MEPAAIDWRKVHHRLKAAQAAIEAGFAPTTAEQNKILKARARTLAQTKRRRRPMRNTWKC